MHSTKISTKSWMMASTTRPNPSMLRQARTAFENKYTMESVAHYWISLAVHDAIGGHLARIRAERDRFTNERSTLDWFRERAQYDSPVSWLKATLLVEEMYA
jgi:hypothetical protein